MQLNIQALGQIKVALLMLSVLAFMMTAWAAAAAATVSEWPGGSAVQTVDASGTFSSNLSGLAYEASGSATPGVLWAVRNGPERLYRLVWDGTIWTPDTADGWATGKELRYPNGSIRPDTEGIAFAAGTADGFYVGTERSNAVGAVRRNSILRFDASAAAPLNATHEWNLTADLPAVGGPNEGIEGITWIPDSFLTAKGFFDESKGRAYTPADYSDHAGGIFFVGVEATGIIYGYALNHADSSFTRVAEIGSPFLAVMALDFDRELHNLWAVCDDFRNVSGTPGCNGRAAVLEIDTHPGSPTKGQFVVTHVYERPAGMPNLNNEGFTMAPQAECVDNLKPAFWADDNDTGGHSIRAGTVTCGPLDKDQCKNDGWQRFGIFNNQGQCVKFVNAGD